METINIDGTLFSVTKETLDALESGIITEELNHKLRKQKGEEYTYDYTRQIRLQKKVMDQITEGMLPEHLLPLVRTGKVPTEILQPLQAQKLIPKAEYLCKKNYISERDFHLIQSCTLTEALIPLLSRALLLDVADYLYSQNEISKQVLDGFHNGSISLNFVKVIRRHYRKMQYGQEISEKFHISYPSTQDDFNTPFYENLGDPNNTIEGILARQQITKVLDEAMSWLSFDEQELISDIYETNIKIKVLAQKYNVDERTIRYRRDAILKKLRFILETLMHVDYESLYLE